MRFSILAIFLFSILYGKSIYAFNNIADSETIASLIGNSQWRESGNSNHIYLFSEDGKLRFIKMNEFDISVNDLNWEVDSQNPDAQLHIFNDEGQVIEELKLSLSNEGLLWQSQTYSNKLLVNTQSNEYKRKVSQVVGLWRGRYLSKKVCLKGERYVQENVAFEFQDNNKFTALYEIDGKEKAINGDYVILWNTKAVLFIPKGKLQRKFSMEIKHISDNEIVLNSNPGKNKAANNITLIR